MIWMRAQQQHRISNKGLHSVSKSKTTSYLQLRLWQIRLATGDILSKDETTGRKSSCSDCLNPRVGKQQFLCLHSWWSLINVFVWLASVLRSLSVLQRKERQWWLAVASRKTWMTQLPLWRHKVFVLPDARVTWLMRNSAEISSKLYNASNGTWRLLFIFSQVCSRFQAVDRFGGIDILVSNAGINPVYTSFTEVHLTTTVYDNSVL